MKGELMEDLTKTEMAILDLFEDDEYTLTEIQVVVAGDASQAGRETSVTTMAYIFDDDTSLYGTWDYAEFRQGLSEYVDMCAEFRADVDDEDLEALVLTM